jgi:hypothetical protein
VVQKRGRSISLHESGEIGLARAKDFQQATIDPVKFAASRSITLIPKTPGKVYDHHCSNVFLYGISPIRETISNIEAAVRRQTKGRLQHKAKLTFLLSQERQEVIKVCRFP